MSFEIPVSFVQQFTSNIYMLAQQKGTKLRPFVRTEPDMLTGKFGYFERVGPTAARKRTTRHSDTPQMNTPHSRRRITMFDYDWADLIDNEDKLRLLIDPTSSYSLNAMWAMGRAQDDEILTAILGTSFAMDDDDNASSVTLPAAQKIAVSGAGLTKAKLLEAREIIYGADVDEDIPLICAVTQKQITNLLNITEVTSADFNTVKALVEGALDTWLGIRFVRTERVNTDSNGDRAVPVWAQDGVGLAIGSEIMTRISERADKNYATQVFASLSVGATRIEEAKVVEIACTES